MVSVDILVYEYLERGSLDTMLSKDVKAKEFGRVNTVKGVAHASSYMHHDCLPAIVHGDISSKNNLLDSEYEASVSDFGTAKFLKPDSSNWTGLAGTYGYLGPELAYGKELAAHQMPIGDVLDQRISPPTHQVAGGVLTLVKIAFSCLSANPHSRPTMQQVSQQLETQRPALSKPLVLITCGELLAHNGFTKATFDSQNVNIRK
ncbi:MDIS1-interacting receptor like kinase 2-like [Rosa rugosa]|uniref:MDIS1-interacting receptor like kinase 2-like n=1 Tax=Rosa rugosa TaxID=74645 RepID=UPI002B401D58|nr:MDIS1-interacting receptor like kinase 2-like [Rosa rugosa]